MNTSLLSSGFSRRLASFGLMFSLMILISCSKNPVTGKKQLNLMGEGQEIALGKQSDPGIVAGFGLYENPAMQSFINTKGQAMAKISHRPHLAYEFKILDSPVVNAFAVPGGYVYFTRGIMAHFNNEAEFAGVLGHEIGHVTARHSAQQYTNQMLGQVLLIGGMIASPEFAQFGDVAMQGMGMLFMKFGRNHESQSDELGVEYSTQIGYDAHEMGDFFKTLDRLSTKDGQQRIPEFQSTHPDPINRFNKVHEMAEEAQSKEPNRTFDVGRDRYLNMIDGLVYGEDPRQGFEENDIFYHPGLKFQFKLPTKWQYQNSPAQVAMGEPNGKAAMYFSLGQGANLQEALNSDLEANKLTLIEQSNKNVNGMPALAAISEQVGQDQQGKEIKIRVMSYFIQYGDMIYKFNGLSYAETFAQYAAVMENTMKSFKKLTDQNKLNRMPDRLKIEKVPSAMTLKQALSKFNTPANRHQELAILNGMELTDALKANMLIKTVSTNNTKARSSSQQSPPTPNESTPLPAKPSTTPKTPTKSTLPTKTKTPTKTTTPTKTKPGVLKKTTPTKKQPPLIKKDGN